VHGGVRYTQHWLSVLLVVCSLFGSVRCVLIQLLRNRPRDTVCWAAGAPLALTLARKHDASATAAASCRHKANDRSKQELRRCVQKRAAVQRYGCLVQKPGLQSAAND